MNLICVGVWVELKSNPTYQNENDFGPSYNSNVNFDTMPLESSPKNSFAIPAFELFIFSLELESFSQPKLDTIINSSF